MLEIHCASRRQREYPLEGCVGGFSKARAVSGIEVRAAPDHPSRGASERAVGGHTYIQSNSYTGQMPSLPYVLRISSGNRCWRWVGCEERRVGWYAVQARAHRGRCLLRAQEDDHGKDRQKRKKLLLWLRQQDGLKYKSTNTSVEERVAKMAETLNMASR